jgi:hypothetical protein
MNRRIWLSCLSFAIMGTALAVDCGPPLGKRYNQTQINAKIDCLSKAIDDANGAEPLTPDSARPIYENDFMRAVLLGASQKIAGSAHPAAADTLATVAVTNKTKKTLLILGILNSFFMADDMGRSCAGPDATIVPAGAAPVAADATDPSSYFRIAPNDTVFFAVACPLPLGAVTDRATRLSLSGNFYRYASDGPQLFSVELPDAAIN